LEQWEKYQGAILNESLRILGTKTALAEYLDMYRQNVNRYINLERMLPLDKYLKLKHFIKRYEINVSHTRPKR
jgi:plasmid maintenance system antidote protein VapI